MNPPLSSDDQINRLFDGTVVILQSKFGYSAEEATSMVREYYQRFRDPAYCKSIGVRVQDDDFFFHEASGGMSLLVHYYLGLKGDPDPRKFLDWRTEYNRQQARSALRGGKG